MEAVAVLMEALASLLLPLALIIFVCTQRKNLSALLKEIVKKLLGATTIEVGSFKINSALVKSDGTVIRDDGDHLKVVDADKSDLKRRDNFHRSHKALFVAHTIRPTEPAEHVEGYRVFEVSVFVQPHKKFGKLNDIQRVEYFLGNKWGKGENGSKFIVDNGSNGFALTANMYGACICVAELFFHDGTSNTQFRYLDVEMAPALGVPITEARYI